MHFYLSDSLKRHIARPKLSFRELGLMTATAVGLSFAGGILSCPCIGYRPTPVTTLYRALPQTEDSPFDKLPHDFFSFCVDACHECFIFSLHLFMGSDSNNLRWPCLSPALPNVNAPKFGAKPQYDVDLLQKNST